MRRAAWTREGADLHPDPADAARRSPPPPARPLGSHRDLVPPSEVLGDEAYELIREIYPMPRSLTGEGVRETLRRVRRRVPFRVVEVPTGTRVYDWVVPKEWNLRAAWIADRAGNRVVDLARSPLHVVGYSVPVRGTISREELLDHVHTIPAQPDWIPYRTSYYGDTWGFCLSERQLAALDDPEYEICIDATLAPGHLTYAEFLVEGERDSEILLSANVCHPVQCNDGLSGIALVATIAKYLQPLRLRHSYRFLLSPGTLGPLAWLAANEERVARIHGALAVTCVGDPGPMTYKQSRHGDAEIDRAVASVLEASGGDFEIQPFVPWGGDERQLSSPGFDVPTGVLTRTPPGAFAEYHTSADDLDYVTPAALADSFEKYLAVLDVLERNVTYVSRNPKGEPHLSRRGLFHTVSGSARASSDLREHAILWVLNLSDGTHSLLDISRRSGLSFDQISAAAADLVRHDLLAEPGATDHA